MTKSNKRQKGYRGCIGIYPNQFFEVDAFSHLWVLYGIKKAGEAAVKKENTTKQVSGEAR